MFSLILYTSGNQPNSVEAASNLKAICLARFPDLHKFEIVDLSQDPRRGLADGITVTPTPAKVAPGPQQMVLGNLSDIPGVLHAIGHVERG